MASQEYKDLSESVRLETLTKNTTNRDEIADIARQVDAGAGSLQVDNQIRAKEVAIGFQQDKLDRTLGKAERDLASGKITPLEYATIEEEVWTLNDGLNDQRGELQTLQRQAYQRNGQFGVQSRSAVQPGQKNPETDTRVSGAGIDEEQQAKSEGANTQSPEPTDDDLVSWQEGEDDPIIPPTEENLEDGKVVAQPELESSQTQAGESNNSDDRQDESAEAVGVSSTVDQRPEIADAFKQTITTKPNELTRYASSTYKISIYLLNREEYVQYVLSDSYQIPSDQLIIQSGGAPAGQRNKYFDLDFYLDDINITTVFGTQAMHSPNTQSNINFKVHEPNGITFLSRLKKAAIEHTGLHEPNANWINQQYLMVINFIGYDQSGNQITSSNNQTKLIPFQISNITYAIQSAGTVYDISAFGVNSNIGFSTSRGTIPFKLQLSAPDVQTLLNGNVELANRQANENDAVDGTPPTTNNRGLKGLTISQGLCEALNKHQELLVSEGIFEFPDTYKVVLEDAKGLVDATMPKPGRRNKKGAATDKRIDIDKYLGSKLFYDKDNQVYNVTAGTQIVQLIDLVMRASSYVTSQQNVIIDEKTGKPSSKLPDVETVQWYRVKVTAVPKEYDTKRRDYAYELTYTISRYKINTPRTPAFPASQFLGVHKEYNYWFTGQNTEVLDFNVKVNANFVTTVDDSGVIDNSEQGDFPSKQSYQSAPNSTLQGGINNSSRPAAALTDRLYSFADVASTELVILGDPDWIEQAQSRYSNQIILEPYTPDGSINTESGEVLFQLTFNPATDVNLTTGLNENLQPLNTNDSQFVKQQSETLVWCATKCESVFKDGAFTQNIHAFNRSFASSKNVPNTPFASTDKFITDPIENDLDPQNLVPQSLPKGAIGATPKVAPEGTFTNTRQITATGSRNFNVDRGLPFRDVQDNGQITRVYGSSSDLQRYYGDLSADDDAGDTVYDN